MCFNDEGDNEDSGEEQYLPDILEEAKERLLSTNQRQTNEDVKDYTPVVETIVKNNPNTE